MRKYLILVMVSVLWENISDMIRLDMCMFCFVIYISYSIFFEDFINKCIIIIF